jgi:hypothetical protein
MRWNSGSFSCHFYFEVFTESSCISTAECPAPGAGIHFLHGGMSNTSMGEGQNVPAPTGGSFYSQICNFLEERSFWVVLVTVYESQCGGMGGVACSCAHHVTWSPNRLWSSTSIFNLCIYCMQWRFNLIASCFRDSWAGFPGHVAAGWGGGTRPDNVVFAFKSQYKLYWKKIQI